MNTYDIFSTLSFVIAASSELVARTFDSSTELVGYERINAKQSTMMVLNVGKQAVMSTKLTESGPKVLIQTEKGKVKSFVRLQSDSAVRATSIAPSADSSRSSVLIVGEHIGDVHMCDGSAKVQSSENGQIESFFALLPSDASTCVTKSGKIHPTGQAIATCTVRGAKAVGLKLDSTTTPHLALAVASRCNSQTVLTEADLGILGAIISNQPASEAPADSDKTKILLKAQAVLLTLDAVSAHGSQVWMGGTIVPTSPKCSDTPSEGEHHPCKISSTEAESISVPITEKGLWIAVLDVSKEGKITVKRLETQVRESARLLSFAFTPSPSPATDYVVDIMTVEKTKICGASMKSSAASTAFSLVTFSPIPLASSSSALIGTTLLDVNIASLEDSLSFEVQSTASRDSGATEKSSKVIVASTFASSSNLKASVSLVHALWREGDITSTLKSELLYQVVQTASDYENGPVLSKATTKSAGKEPLPPISRLLRSFFILPPTSPTRSSRGLQNTLAEEAKSELWAAVQSQSTDSIPFFSFYLLKSSEVTPPPVKVPEKAPEKAPETQQVPPTIAAPVSVPTEPQAPVSASPTPQTPLYETKSMSKTTMWAIFASVLILLAIILAVAYRFYYTRYIANGIQPHHPLPRDLVDP